MHALLGPLPLHSALRIRCRRGAREELAALMLGERGAMSARCAVSGYPRGLGDGRSLTGMLLSTQPYPWRDQVFRTLQRIDGQQF